MDKLLLDQSGGFLGKMLGWEGHKAYNTLKVLCCQLLSGMAMKCNLFLQDMFVIESFADAFENKLSTFLGELCENRFARVGLQDMSMIESFAGAFDRKFSIFLGELL